MSKLSRLFKIADEIESKLPKDILSITYDFNIEDIKQVLMKISIPMGKIAEITVSPPEDPNDKDYDIKVKLYRFYSLYDELRRELFLSSNG